MPMALSSACLDTEHGFKMSFQTCTGARFKQRAQEFILDFRHSNSGFYSVPCRIIFIDCGNCFSVVVKQA